MRQALEVRHRICSLTLKSRKAQVEWCIGIKLILQAGEDSVVDERATLCILCRLLLLVRWCRTLRGTRRMNPHSNACSQLAGAVDTQQRLTVVDAAHRPRLTLAGDGGLPLNHQPPPDAADILQPHSGLLRFAGEPLHLHHLSLHQLAAAAQPSTGRQMLCSLGGEELPLPPQQRRGEGARRLPPPRQRPDEGVQGLPLPRQRPVEGAALLPAPPRWHLQCVVGVPLSVPPLLLHPAHPHRRLPQRGEGAACRTDTPARTTL